MAYGSQPVNKLDYARYLTASIAYLSGQQRDGTGIVVFDDEIRDYVQPSSRTGQFARILHAIENANPGTRTDFAKPFFHCQNFLHRKGIIVVVSDFYDDPELVVKTMEPMRFHGNEIILFHVLDPQEIRPKIKDPALVLDMETGETMEVTPDYVRNEYGPRIDAHITGLRERAQRSGIDCVLIDTSRPLDDALRSYLLLRQGRA
jgi:uncharacterized protein (DUF58 family)